MKCMPLRKIVPQRVRFTEIKKHLKHPHRVGDLFESSY